MPKKLTTVDKDLAPFLEQYDPWTDFAPREAPDLEAARARITTGWRAHEAAFRAGLAEADERGRALWEMARAFVEAGMPLERRDPVEQAAFYVASTQTSGDGYPAIDDFGARWLAVGDLSDVVEIGLRAGRILCRNLQGWDRVALVEWTEGDAPPTAQFYGWRVLLWLRVPLARCPADERVALREALAPRARALHPLALASLAVGFGDAAWAREAAARVQALPPRQSLFALPYQWPIALLDVLEDGPAFASHLRFGAQQFQFHGPGYMARAVKRLPAADAASALLGFFEAALAQPKRFKATYVKRFATIAGCVDDPRLAAFLREHQAHQWFARAAATHAARFAR